MRAIQARYHAAWALGRIAGEPYISWPDADKVAAPAFPPNGFYGNLNKNLAKAIETTRAIDTAFWDTKLYSEYRKDFVLGSPVFNPMTLPYARATNLNAGNWQGVVAQSHANTLVLRYTDIPTSLVGTNYQVGTFQGSYVELREGQASSEDFSNIYDLASAKSQAIANWNAASWQACQDEPGLSEEQSDVDGYWACITTKRAHVRCDLKDLHGQLEIYYGVDDGGDGYAGYLEATSCPPPNEFLDCEIHLAFAIPDAKGECLSPLIGFTNATPAFADTNRWDNGEGQWTIHPYGAIFAMAAVAFEIPGESGEDSDRCCTCDGQQVGEVPLNESGFLKMSLGQTTANRPAYLTLGAEQWYPELTNFASLAFHGITRPPTQQGALIIDDKVLKEAEVEITKAATGRGYVINLYRPQTNAGHGELFSSVTVCATPNRTNALSLFTNGVEVSRCQFYPETRSRSILRGTGGTYANFDPAILEGNILKFESYTETTNQTQRIVTHEIRSAPNEAAALVTQRKYERLACGEMLVELVEGPGEAHPRVTQWGYVTSTNDPNLGLTRWMKAPGGYWEIYGYDEYQRLCSTCSPFGSTPFPEDLIPPTNSCRVTATEYSLIGQTNRVVTWQAIPKDGGGMLEVSRQETLSDYDYAAAYVAFQAVQTTIQFDYIGSTNFTITTNRSLILLDSDRFVATNRLISTTTSSGQKTTYNYRINNNILLTAITNSFRPAGQAGWTDDSATISSIGSFGENYGTTNFDLASGVVTSRDYTPSNLFDNRRPKAVFHLNGTSNVFSYSCCALESQMDQDGVATSYGYDDLKRRTWIFRAGVVTSNAYDAAGHVVRSWRGNDEQTMVPVNASGYDTAGRLIWRAEHYTNGAFQRWTTNSETFDSSAPFRTLTVRYPDGAISTTVYNRDGSQTNLTGSAVHGVRYEYGADNLGQHQKETLLTDNGTDSSEWTKTWTGYQGKTLRVERSGVSGAWETFYDNQGRVWKEVDPDGVRQLSLYNGKGEMTSSGIDVNRDGQLTPLYDHASTNVNLFDNSSVGSLTGPVRRTISYTFADGSLTNSSTTEYALSSQDTWSTSYGLISSSHTSVDAPGRKTTTSTAPDNTRTITTYANGLLLSVARQDASGQPISQVDYGYDNLNRLRWTTNSSAGRQIVNDATLDPSDQVIQSTVSGGGLSQTTASDYTLRGAVWRVTLPDANKVTNLFDHKGQLITNTGARTYPVTYGYDYAGRRSTLTTYTTGLAGAATTTWNYNPAGLLESKVYADTTHVDYGYTDGGRLSSRTWARGTVTTYTNTGAGQVVAIGYNDGVTPGVSFQYDTLGRTKQVVRNGVTTVLSNSTAGPLLSESYSDTNVTNPLNGITVANHYNALLQRDSLALRRSGTDFYSVGYGYDAAGRFKTVTNDANTFEYSDWTGEAGWGTLTYKVNGTTRMTVSRIFDGLNRLQSISSLPVDGSTVSFSYGYNLANQRVSTALSDASSIDYQYDFWGQVTNATKKWADTSLVAGQQFAYLFDTIGNRLWDQQGAEVLQHRYTNNVLNQIKARTEPGAIIITGTATNGATVKVNRQVASRHGDYFERELTLNNTSNCLWLGVTNTAILALGTNGELFSTNIGYAFIPQNPSSLDYDDDGNLRQDGRFSYQWDAENRLISVLSRTNTPANSWISASYGYDWMGRRTSKTVSNYVSGAWVKTSDLRFVYDGWNPVAVLDGNGTLLYSFIWGLDLSGTPQGAGGIGGLLAMVVHTGPNGGTYFYCYDGNGNVAGLINAANGQSVAKYEYGPFGEALQMTGALATINPVRFSTKFQDDESRLVYYGHRYYDAGTGRWLSRDPAEEEGGINLYGFAGNNSVNSVDLLGLFRVIWLGFGYDTSATFNGSRSKIAEGILFLEEKLRECSWIKRCECGGDYTWDDVHVKVLYDFKNKPAPKEKYYDMRDWRNNPTYKLFIDNIWSINTVGVNARILVTWYPIWAKRSSGDFVTAAVANPRIRAILYNPRHLFSPAQVIAHELGHVAFYVGNASDRVHSTDPENLMGGGQKVDCQWCQKVTALAR